MQLCYLCLPEFTFKDLNTFNYPNRYYCRGHNTLGEIEAISAVGVY